MELSHRALSQHSFSIFFFQIFALRAKIWKKQRWKYLAAAGETGDQSQTTMLVRKS
jgi:hypothetical protein